MTLKLGVHAYARRTSYAQGDWMPIFGSVFYRDQPESRRGLDRRELPRVVLYRIRSVTLVPPLDTWWITGGTVVDSNETSPGDGDEVGYDWPLIATARIGFDWPSDVYSLEVTVLATGGTGSEPDGEVLSTKTHFVVLGDRVARPFLPSDPNPRLRSPIVPSSGFPQGARDLTQARGDRPLGPASLARGPTAEVRGSAARATASLRTRSGGPQSRILYCWPLATLHAYYPEPGIPRESAEPSAGYSAYLYDDYKRRRRTSLDRPLSLGPGSRERALADLLRAKEIPFDSCASLDLHREADDFLAGYDLLILCGHDEYWSWEMRDHVERFVKRGGNLLNLSGNTCWWQVYFEPAPDGTPDRIMACYKSSFEDPIVRTKPERATVTWMGPPVNRPENLMIGLSYRFGAQNNHTGEPYTLLAPSGRPSIAWLLKDTGIKVGSEFGGTLVNYETDGAQVVEKVVGTFPLEVVAGVVPTGRDGSPINLEVVAYRDLADWLSAPLDGEPGKATEGDGGAQGGNALLAVFRQGAKGGLVVSGGTTDWCLALSNPAIQTLTLNAVRELDRPRPDLPVTAGAFPWKGYGLGVDWAPVAAPGLPVGAIVRGLTGHVSGHLFAVTDDGKLWHRQPFPDAYPWAEVDTGGPLRATALGAELIGTGRIFACVGRALYRRRPEDTPWPWHRVEEFSEDLAGMAVTSATPVLLDVRGRLYFDKVAKALAPGIRSITSADRMYVGLRDDGAIVVRDSTPLDIRWRKVDDAPAATVAIAWYYGFLYAIAANGDLKWRSPTAVAVDPATGTRSLTTMHPGWVVAYRRTMGPAGEARVFRFHPNGDVSHEDAGEPRPWILDSCNLVVGAGDDRHVLFVSPGQVRVAEVTPFEGKLVPKAKQPLVTSTGKIVLAVAIGVGRVLLYERNGMCHVVAVDAKGEPTITRFIEGTLPADLTALASTDDHVVVGHVRPTGAVYVGAWDAAAEKLTLSPKGNVAPGATHAAGLGHGKVLLFNAATAAGHVIRVTATGVGKPVAVAIAGTEPLSVAPTPSGFPPQVHVVSGSCGLALFYEAGEAYPVTGGVAEGLDVGGQLSCSWETLRVYRPGHLGSTDWREGWDSMTAA